MRVTLVSPFDAKRRLASVDDGHARGVERAFGNLARELCARGHEVTFIGSAPHGMGEHRVGTIVEAPLGQLGRSLHGSDIVHVAATSPQTTAEVLRRARELGIPSVLDFHCEAGPGTARRLAAKVRRRGVCSYGPASAVLVRSMRQGRTAASLASIPESQWRVVPNGVDPERFRPGPATAGGYLLFAGPLVASSGLDVLLRALARRRPGLPLLVAGDGLLRRRLEHLAKRLAVDVQFLGQVSEAHLPGIYRGARATIFPSTAAQAFGMPLLESMACGTPVVASNLPGIEEVARLGGLVARAGDPCSLGTQVLRAVESDLLVRGPRLSAPIHRDYSWSAVADRVVAAYRELLGPPIKLNT